jgi:hypothetical protein
VLERSPCTSRTQSCPVDERFPRMTRRVTYASLSIALHLITIVAVSSFSPSQHKCFDRAFPLFILGHFGTVVVLFVNSKGPTGHRQYCQSPIMRDMVSVIIAPRRGIYENAKTRRPPAQQGRVIAGCISAIETFVRSNRSQYQASSSTQRPRKARQRRFFVRS